MCLSRFSLPLIYSPAFVWFMTFLNDSHFSLLLFKVIEGDPDFLFIYFHIYIYKIKYATGCITTKNIEKLTVSCHSIRFLWPWPSHTDAILRLWRLRRLKGWHSIWKYELFWKKWKVSDDYAMVQKYCWPRAGWAEPS